MRPGLTAVVAAALWTTVGLAQPDPPAPKARTDADGVPLPEGAITRLGSARFRFSGGSNGPLVFSPDGKLLAIAWEGVFLFDVATSRLLHDLRLPDGHSPHAVRFLADGKRVAVGSIKAGGPKLVFFALADGKPVGSPDLSSQRATHVLDVTPDGSRALLLDSLKKAYMWDLKAGRELWSCEHPGGTSIRPLTPDGKLFAVARGGGSELRDADTGKVVARFPDAGRQSGDPHRTQLSPDGRLATASPSGDTVTVLAARGPAGRRTLPADLLGPYQLTVSADSRYLVGAGRVRTQVWDLTAADDKGPVARLPAADSAGFSPDGKTLALAGTGFVALYSVGDWKAQPQSADPPAAVHRLHVPDDGRWVFGYTQEGWVRWLAGGGPADRPFAGDIPGTRAMATAGVAAVSADGRVAAEIVSQRAGKGRRGALVVADAGGGNPRSIPLDGQPWTPLYLSPDGRQVAIPVSGEARVWDTRTGEILFRRPRVEGEVYLGALPAPDGRSFARSVIGTSSGDRTGDGPGFAAVTVTDHETGRSGKMSPVPWTLFEGARFSRDGTRIYGRGRFSESTSKHMVSVWDARTGRRLAAWTGEYGESGATGLSADNRSLLVGDRAGLMTLVEVATGGERARFQHRGPVLGAAFFPDGKRAVASSPDGPVYVWDLFGDPGKWDAAKADAVWADLASTNAKVAFSAIRKLRANPAEAVAFLRDRVKLPAPPTGEALAALLKRLDGPRFADRERAQQELTGVGELVRPRLEAARKTASEEAGRRLDQVLKTTEGLTPERLRHLRACEVLEGIGMPEAVAVMRGWAGGPEGARLTAEAKESLTRLKP